VLSLDYTSDDVCELASDEGEYCTGWEQRWFYDVEHQLCRIFWYGGCKGNGNRFTTEQECTDLCVTSRATQQPTTCTQYTITIASIILIKKLKLKLNSFKDSQL